MRIYFGIFHDREVKWPKRCAWCESKATHWQKYKKKTIYDFQFIIPPPLFGIIPVLGFKRLSGVMTINYPVCRLHSILAKILKPTRLIIAFLIFNVSLFPALNFNRYIAWIMNIFMVFGFYYFWKKAVILHKVYGKHMELSIPYGEYAKEFGLLNKCHNIDRHLLMQD